MIDIAIDGADEVDVQGRHILLLMDNAPCHILPPELSHVKVVFLPANTTSVTQPLDAGVIKNFKVKYRKYLINHILSCLENSTFDFSSNFMSKVDIKQAVTWMKRAWMDVTPTTIGNCFPHCGLASERPGAEEESKENNDGADDEIAEEPVDEVAEVAAMASSIGVDPSDFIFDESVAAFDTEVRNWEEVILNPPVEVPSSSDDDEDEPPRIPTMYDVSYAINILTAWN